jgi:hypothetical protein
MAAAVSSLLKSLADQIPLLEFKQRRDGFDAELF